MTVKTTQNAFRFPEHVFVIAEIGVNHEGDFQKAADMIRLAAQSGADAVKFQTYLAEEYVSASQPERLARVKRFQLSFDQFRRLSKIARENRIIFMSTPLGPESLKVICELSPIIKISSGDITNYPFLKKVAESKKKIILSTGLSQVKEIEKAVSVMRSANPHLVKNKNLILLHCVAAYPTPEEEANLLSIPYLKESFGFPVGYSDHTNDILAAQTAVALGACVIEKHFTYQREGQSFHDHQLSATPQEFKELVTKIRRIEKMKGAFAKKFMPAERSFLNHIRRSYAVTRDLKAGESITKKDLCLLRPGLGFPADQAKKLVGRKIKNNIGRGEIILKEHLAGSK